MHRIRVHQVARRGPCAQSVRLNSTVSGQPKRDETTQPSSASNQPRVSSYHGLVIPSREEVLKNPNVYMAYKPFSDQSKTFKPSLSYLTKGGSSGFAQRLAQQQLSQSQPRAGTNSYPQALNDRWKRRSSQPRNSPADAQALGKGEGQEASRQNMSSPQRTRHNLPRTEAPPPPRDQKSRPPPHDRPRLSKHDDSASANPSKNVARFDGTELSASSKHPRSDQRDRRVHNKPGGNLDAQSQRKRPRRKPQDAGGRSKAPVVFKALRPVKGTLEESIGGEKDVDDWDPDETPPLPPNAASVTSPDVPFVHLASTMSPPPTSRHLLAASTSTSLNPTEVASLLSADRAQWLRGTIGGDYSQYAPQAPQDYITSHVKLGPLNHSQLVLAHQRDVSLAQRNIVANVVRSSV